MKSIIKTLTVYLLGAIAGVGIYFLCVIIFHPVFVAGESMSPTFKSGKIILGNTKINDISEINYGDIIICKSENKNIIKRVVALPKDEVAIIDGVLLVNNKPSLAYDYPVIEDGGIINNKSLILSNEELFVIGDNVNNSVDSRVIGPINFNNVKYKIKLK